MGHLWSYSAWVAHVDGALASNLRVHINMRFIVINIFFSEFK